ncbi:MAG: type I restriction enzyme R subunit [Cryomorphaceae bacterium]|jgi:type I restriction enzyme R subunit
MFGRAAKILLENSKLQEIEEYYARCAEQGATGYSIEESKKAMTQMKSILGDPDRLKALAADFVTHYETRVNEGSTVIGKAIFVCTSREIGYDFYKQCIDLRPEWAEATACDEGSTLTESEMKEIKPMPHLKMVMTRGKDDEKKLWDLVGTRHDRQEADKQFKNEKSNFKIAIVVDMWLTGFDVPFLDTIYIDKPIEKHNLVQTISRVNRKFAGKNKGLVVDYFGIKTQMNQALAKYSKADASNIEEIAQSNTVVRDHLDLLNRLFHQFDKTPYFTGQPMDQLECLNKVAEFAQLTEKIEVRFMALVKRLKAAYDICCGSEEIISDERDQIHFYLAVRSIVFKLTKGDAPDSTQMNAKVRKMIQEALKSDGVEEIFKLGDEAATEIDLFDDDYLDKIDKIKLPITKIKLLQQMLKKAIEDCKKINKIKSLDFTQKFQSLVNTYNEREEIDQWSTEGVTKLTNEFFDLVGALKKERESFSDLGIELEEKAYYDILKTLAEKYDFDYPEDKLIKLAKEVKTVVDYKAKYTD